MSDKMYGYCGWDVDGDCGVTTIETFIDEDAAYTNTDFIEIQTVHAYPNIIGITSNDSADRITVNLTVEEAKRMANTLLEWATKTENQNV